MCCHVPSFLSFQNHAMFFFKLVVLVVAIVFLFCEKGFLYFQGSSYRPFFFSVVSIKDKGNKYSEICEKN